MKKAGFWVFACSLLSAMMVGTAHGFDTSSNTNMVMYWGQNSYGQVGSQLDLASYCQDSTNDIIVIAFLSIFFDSSSGLPEVNFAGSCDGGYFDGTNLLQCPQIAEDIVACQANGKKVFLSLGGASGSYGFDSESQAETFAATLWELFGGGSSSTRPFGDAVVDGFDLDIEGGSSAGYAAFVTAMRSYYADYPDKDMYISCAPQCPIPDSFLNDAMVNSYFDFYFVQFFNNYCGIDQWSGTESTNFNFGSWDSFAKTASYNTDVKVYLGVAASSTAAGTGYVTIDTLNEAAAQLMSTYSSFGGIMMWDASQAYNNIPEDGLNYAQLAKAGLVMAASAEVSPSLADIATERDYSSLISSRTIADVITEATVADTATTRPSDESGWPSATDETTLPLTETTTSSSAEATVLTISSLTLSSQVQTLIVGKMTDFSILSSTSYVTPTATYPIVSVSPSASESITSATFEDGETEIISYTSTVYNAAFSTSVEIILFSTVTSLAGEADSISSIAGRTTSSVEEFTSALASVQQTSSLPGVWTSSTESISSHNDVMAGTSEIFVSAHTVHLTATTFVGTTESSITEIGSPTLTVGDVTNTAEDASEWTSASSTEEGSSLAYAVLQTTIGKPAPSTSIYTISPAPSFTDSEQETTTTSDTVGTSTYTVIDTTPTLSASMTFITSPPWSATASTSSSTASVSSSSEVSSCPIDGAPCAVHGELACNGYYWGQCVWGTWVVRQCYTGLMCKTDASYVYCDYPGADTVTTCAVTTPSDLTKRSSPAAAPRQRTHPHMHTRRNTFHSPFYDPELGKKYFPHVPVRRQVESDSIAVIKDAVDVLPLPRYSNMTLAATAAVTDPVYSSTVMYSTAVPTPTVIQQVQFVAARGYTSSTMTAPYASATATATESAIVSASGLDEAAGSDSGEYVLGISIQQLNSTNFVGTLSAAPRTNTPIGRSWTFVFSSSGIIDKVSRGELTSLGNGSYQVSSIDTEEASSYMAIRLTFWGTYAGSSSDDV
ncbi:uncharacterized protein V1513DRAFT_442231 [Lipomyces chichibuensis]|uniref:uncharacterized protein n=1 Tax=Lipomyces chichibuensis TaxID=1546026 RepID=UPI00334415E0